MYYLLHDVFWVTSILIFLNMHISYISANISNRIFYQRQKQEIQEFFKAVTPIALRAAEVIEGKVKVYVGRAIMFM